MEKRFNIRQKTVGISEEALKLYAVLEPCKMYQSSEMQALAGSKLAFSHLTYPESPAVERVIQPADISF